MSGIQIVDNFVCREECQGIWVVLEALNVAEDVLEIASIIACPRFSSIERHLRRVDIDNDVNTGRIEDAHAKIVVGGWVHVVDTNCVDLGKLESS